MLVVCACAGEPRNSGDPSEASSSVSGVTESTTADSSTADSSTADSSTADASTSDAPPRFDVQATFDLGPVEGRCKVEDGMDGIGRCTAKAPPDSFDPVVQWSFAAPGYDGSYVTPLVVNLTDDNGDAAIDLCDTPDVVLVVASFTTGLGRIHVLDGADGSVHFKIEDPVEFSFTPAVGDIDADGLPEIVTLDSEDAFVVFEHDGTLKWRVPTTWGDGPLHGQSLSYGSAAALADMDNDGDVEILAANQVIGHEGGTPLLLPDVPGDWSSVVPIDLDDDGDLEIVLGRSAYHHDGTIHYETSLEPGYPQVADVEKDGSPEILLTNVNGLSMLEADGTIRYSDLRPTGDPVDFTTWHRPAMFHDIDGDGFPEFGVSSANTYAIYEHDASLVWIAQVQDPSGIAGSTAFDFLGRGTAQAMYADEVSLFVYDSNGLVLLEVPRRSGTLVEYPVVADIDNDGSAEILVVSDGGSFVLQAIADREDRWIQARRIWNQHAYHVTNVREDGTIPQYESPHWESFNTYRTNAQIEGGSLCAPIPEG